MSVCILLEEDNSSPGCSMEAMIATLLVDHREGHGLVSYVHLSSVSNLFKKQSTTFDISHDSIDNDHNDSVRLTVMLEDMRFLHYPTALLIKTPSWQTASSLDQPSLLEFTLPEFSKRIEICNFFFIGPDFYSQEKGYRFHLEVYVAGDLMDENCVSLFLYLMAGEYDDQLVWPLTGEFVIELLNWRENRAHLKKTFSCDGIDRAPVGLEGKQIIYDRFISHSLLSYDPVKNTEYLYEDCLRFRINLNN